MPETLVLEHRELQEEEENCHGRVKLLPKTPHLVKQTARKMSNGFQQGKEKAAIS